METLYWCALFFGVLCTGYYIVILLYAGMGINFSWIWCFGGISGFGFSLIIRYILRRQLCLSVWLVNLVYLIIAVSVIAFLILESLLVFCSHQKAEADLDYLLVLGAQIKENKVSKNLKKRLDTALIYLRQNKRTQVIVSGGRGTNELISEAAAMKAYLLDQGIESDRILTEDQSSNTTENLRFSRRLIRQNASVAIVTNGFHIYRSVKLAKKQEISRLYALVAPTEPVLSLHYYVREAAGVMKDWLKGNL